MKVRSSCAFEKLLVVLTVLIACFGATSDAQQTTSVVPTLVNFSGTLTDASGKPLTGTVGVTFYLYKDDQGGSPLWMETQNVQPDKAGHYTVALGSSKNEGLPTSLFASGEARWLAVQAQGQAEQPRVLLLSVPYALKAGDAQTIGGLSPSAFVLAASPNSGSSAGSSGFQLRPKCTPAGRDRHHGLFAHLDQQHHFRQFGIVPVGHRSKGQGRHWHHETGIHAGRERRRYDSWLVQSARNWDRDSESGL